MRPAATLVAAPAVTAACGGAPRYVGSATCAACHEAQTLAWRQSDHTRAMRPATDSAVQGDFSDRLLVHYGDTVRVTAREGRRMVTLAGADGRPASYPITHTFGAYPLQQYLVAFPRGRYQALPVAWDTRPDTAGGARWFHLYRDEPIRAGDELFWTGIAQNWNFMCAECHSTDLRKNYIAARDSFATTWSEIDVACEACHGPGSRHVAMERTILGVKRPPRPGRGLTVRFDERAGVTWS